MALLGLFSYDGAVDRTFRQRLGDRFLHYRHQVKGWKNLEDAKRETGIDPKTIKGIEDGTGNPRLSSLIEYADGLDAGIERILMESVAITARPGQANPEAETLARIYLDLTDVNSRRLLLAMAEKFLAADRPPTSGAEPSAAGALENQGSIVEAAGGVQKTQKA